MELTSIAFIPDGNMRDAQTRGISLVEAYQLGTQKAWKVFEWLQDYPRVKVGTFWAMSTENFKRTAELPILFKIFEHELDKVKNAGLFETHQVRLKFIGRLNLFPKKLVEKMRNVMEFTENFKGRTMNVAIGYGGRSEILDAAKHLATDYKQGKVDLSKVDENAFSRYLYGSFPDPDLIVRTSGTRRLSGFLPYQSGYSELYFLDKYWPEFSKADLQGAINDYNERQRNFGK